MHDNHSYSPPPHQQRTAMQQQHHFNSSYNGSGDNSTGGERARSNNRSRPAKDPAGRVAPSSVGESFGMAPPARQQHRRQSSRQHASAAARGRRRPTNYTSSYTPPAGLAEYAAKAREGQNANSVLAPGSSSSRRKCSSLDRSEGDGDERRRHLKSGKQPPPPPPKQGGGDPVGELAVDKRTGDDRQVKQQQQRLSQEQMQLQRMQKQQQQEQRLREEQESAGDSYQQQQQVKQLQHMQRQQEQKQLQLEQRHSMHEQYYSQPSNSQKQPRQQLQRGGQNFKNHRQGGNNSNRSGTSGLSGVSGHSSPRTNQEYGESPVNSFHKQEGRVSSNRGSRRASQEGPGSSPRSPQNNGREGRKKYGNEKRGSRRSSNSRNDNRSRSSHDADDDSDMMEQQRIEEYAGKRALLRLEQELADHSESQSAMNNEHGDVFKSVMDRKKLARVPQVKKSDLIIGEYLGRGNFCDVFEVTWTLPEQRNGGLINGWSSNRTLSTYGTDDGSDGESNLEASMDSLALSCSNDLSLMPSRGEGLAKSASRRSISQIRTSTADPRPPRRGDFGRSTTSLRNPNVLALKCLRPAVRAQPRKFVIGAEDLAHETALLACLDHPNIIQLYGRAEGCFSTAFQMRSKNSSNDGGGRGNPQRSEGKQMSNEGYFIILDRLMTTLTDRIEEWRSECRAINGVSPADGTPIQMPPETTLREHLCKRLKVAYCIADALEYLHSRHVVFRDLKPANVGFDCNDCVKMFDFGFATSVAPLLSQPYEGYGPLTETCGTRRYMAPEVALKLGYGKEVDVYSFGMLLWEICALDKPFDSIQSVDEFHDLVVLCGRRPSLNIDPLWTPSLKNLMCRCWSTDPLDRPTMCETKALLCNVLRDMNRAMETSSQQNRGGNSGSRGGNNGSDGGGRNGSAAQRQEQGGNFIHKW
eukprot:CAMPEP_0172558664 /NCGR_PEP_ID=MMETSP1067-20121228/80201_1 /TAXON_ID=265564 ORGANISM="Thalassiosira punctigera, Strain Tpunct2005C2" /NCGR_SAMPLE_ID=MMETSP1067 /ASSEMBLY_ACC=CAM_ASM_000444 /LENGTH=921 /DNA_ID=CAMNT_0013348069 /DNA_START=311 /DNA_END=3073 /DNA_ORIENTATION=+